VSHRVNHLLSHNNIVMNIVMNITTLNKTSLIRRNDTIQERLILFTMTLVIIYKQHYIKL
jgi:hypothetical protein